MRVAAINLSVILAFSLSCSPGNTSAPLLHSKSEDQANAGNEVDPNARLKARQKVYETQIGQLEAEIQSAEVMMDGDVRAVMVQLDSKETERFGLALQVSDKDLEINRKSSEISQLASTQASLQATNRSLSRQLQTVRADLQQCRAMP